MNILIINEDFKKGMVEKVQEGGKRRKTRKQRKQRKQRKSRK